MISVFFPYYQCGDADRQKVRPAGSHRRDLADSQPYPPRIEPPSRTAKSLLIGAILSFRTFVTSGALWLEATELNALGKNAGVMNLGREVTRNLCSGHSQDCREKDG